MTRPYSFYTAVRNLKVNLEAYNLVSLHFAHIKDELPEKPKGLGLKIERETDREPPIDHTHTAPF